jgi:glutamate-5-semialdehyde dehydrogenase
MKPESFRKAQLAKKASFSLLRCPSKVKNKVLLETAQALLSHQEEILQANHRDLEKAKTEKLSSALIDRLTLTPARIKAMSVGLEEIAQLKDPVGEIINFKTLSNGVRLGKMRVPLGVVGIIYESRPNVTIEAAALCFKSSNAVILRGSRTAINSNLTLARIMRKVLKEVANLEDILQIIETTAHQEVLEMLKLAEFIDVIIPRASQQTIKFILEHSAIPVISHGEGNCHLYVDEDADLKMAEKIVFNAKVQRPGVCNALETLLVHQKIAPKFLPPMIDKLKKAKVEIRGCLETKKLVPKIKRAKKEDFRKEYLDLILAVKIVEGLNQAIEQINTYGSHHSDGIITSSYQKAWRFLNEVDSSSVFVNASTRLADGGVYGLGAEIGISTQKLHARGPMGLEELTTTKFIALGDGQIRE